jgi:hypothetical protein
MVRVFATEHHKRCLEDDRDWFVMFLSLTGQLGPIVSTFKLFKRHLIGSACGIHGTPGHPLKLP